MTEVKDENTSKDDEKTEVTVKVVKDKLNAEKSLSVKKKTSSELVNTKLNSMLPMDLINDNSIIDAIVKSKITPANTKSEDIKAAILIGAEVGLKPMTSVLMVGQLTFGNIPKIIKGMSLGLDVMTSIDKVHVIKTSGKEITVVDNNIIQGLLRKAKVAVTILSDCEPIKVKKILSKEKKGLILDPRLEELFKDRLVEFHTDYDQTVVDSIKDDIPDALFYTETIIDYKTVIHFNRVGFGEHTETYYYSQAVDTGLTTKDSWRDKRIMMRHRCFGRGARFIAGDVLNGAYLPGETLEIVDDYVELKDTNSE